MSDKDINSLIFKCKDDDTLLEYYLNKTEEIKIFLVYNFYLNTFGVFYEKNSNH